MRFLSDKTPAKRAEFLDAAREYMGAMDGFELDWLYRKPYDPRAGNDQFYLQVYAVMNLLRAMEITPGGRVLEVGSGPGWVSELLMLLGYEVDGIEPCQDLIDVAEDRIAKAHALYRVSEQPDQSAVRFHATTMEEFAGEAASFDAVLFHDALHHVLDETVVFERCFRLLKPGGVLGVSEDAWRPGNREQESALEEEIARFGTHESPFTRDYLDKILEVAGFVDVERYHAVNGFFPEELGGRTIAEVAQSRADNSNNLTARKPFFEGPSTRDEAADTRASIEILKSTFDRGDRRLVLNLRLSNRGETAWLHRPRGHGWVSVAVRSEPLGGDDHREARPRHRLPKDLLPGQSLELTLEFFFDEDYGGKDWRVDLVNEGRFWFSQRGTQPAKVLRP